MPQEEKDKYKCQLDKSSQSENLEFLNQNSPIIPNSNPQI